MKLLIGDDVEQPQQEKERHHRGDEVGIGDLPGATMVAAVANALDPLDDERLLSGHLCSWLYLDALEGFLQFAEAGSALRLKGLARDLDRHLWRVTLHVSDNAGLDALDVAELGMERAL